MLLTVLLTCFVTLFAILFAKWYQSYKKYKHLMGKIPGPPSNIVFGHCLQMLGTADHMWNFFQTQNKKYYPIYKLLTGTLPVVELLGPSEIESVLSSKKHLEKSMFYKWMEPWLGTGLLTSKGSKFHYRRKLLTPAFHFSILQQFSKTIIEQSQILVKKLEEECDKPFTIINPFITRFTLYTICETAMGTQLDDKREEVIEYVKAVYGMGQLMIDRIQRPWLFPDIIYYFSALKRKEKIYLKTLHNFTRSVIRDRQNQFQKQTVDSNIEGKERLGLMDLLISLKNEGVAIDDEGIREEVDTFMFEGHDTTSSAIVFGLLTLSNHPDVQENIYKEIMEVMEYSDRQFTFSDLQKMSYLEMVIKECLRLFPSVPLIARRTESDITTSSGYVIPANTIVHIHIYGMHHHPEVYPNPEKCDPERFSPENSKSRHPFAFLPFSAGSRNCIGQRFAMIKLKCAIASIIRKFLLLPVDKPEDVQFTLHFVLKSTKSTRIKIMGRV